MQITTTTGDMLLNVFFGVIAGIAATFLYARFPNVVRAARDAWSRRSNKAAQRNLERLEKELKQYEELVVRDADYFRRALDMLATTLMLNFFALANLIMGMGLFSAETNRILRRIVVPPENGEIIGNRFGAIAVLVCTGLLFSFCLIGGRLSYDRLRNYLRPGTYVPNLRNSIARTQRRLVGT